MTQAKRLLILDDDPMIGQTIRHIAEHSGFKVEVTAQAENFFHVLETWRPDFIALDLIMPEMDGVEVMAELARRDCRSRVIITSGVGNRILDAAGRSASEHGLNIAGVLAKPFTPSSLRELLKESAAVLPAQAGAADAQAPEAGDEAEDRRRALGAADLEKAILNKELFVVYQPKVVCLTGVLAGFEALARWRHQELGEISPGFFIPLAEANGLVDALTRELLNQSLHWFGEFCAGQDGEPDGHAQDRSKLTLSINISALSLSNQSLFDHLNELCEEVGIPPRRLIFELTETSAMEDPVTSLDLLTRLRMKGFHLSIDDFGTGFSSMLQLVRLPFSEIKVDRSFIATARNSSESRAVVKSITELGHSLGLQITAEGIEDEETLIYLRNLGCDHLQGYLIARPMPGSQVIEWLRRREPSNEERRVASLYALGLLDTEAEERFDTLTSLAQRLFDVPMVSLTLVDRDRLWLKSRTGVAVTQLPRNTSFCTYTIESDEVNVIPDTHKDMRFSANKNVVGPPHIRFYAGQSISARDGGRVGTLCLLDRKPREFSEQERAALADLAQLVEKELRNEAPNARDPYTQAFSQAAFEERAACVLGLCQRLRLASALLLFQIQNLEVEADGSEPAKKNLYKLAAFSRLLNQSLRSSDIVGRIGADKFIVLLFGAGAQELEDVRGRFDRRVIDYNKDSIKGLELRFDMGYATVADPAQVQNLQSLLARAEMNILQP